MKMPVCPSCQQAIGLTRLMRFSTLYGTRRIQACPGCGVPLRWKLPAFAAMNLGSAVLIAAAASVFILSERLLIAWNTPTQLFAVGAAIAVLGMAGLRLETAG